MSRKRTRFGETFIALVAGVKTLDVIGDERRRRALAADAAHADAAAAVEQLGGCGRFPAVARRYTALQMVVAAVVARFAALVARPAPLHSLVLGA